MTKHTPAPWGFDKNDGEIFYDDGDVRPAIAMVYYDNTDDPQYLADARLIVAAPELLAFARMVAAGNTEIIELERRARNLVTKAGG